MKSSKKNKKIRLQAATQQKDMNFTSTPIQSPNPEFPALSLSQGKVYRRNLVDNFEYYEEVVLPPVEIAINWTGPRIPLAIWYQILAFFEVSYHLTKGETQMRLYFNKDTGEWKTWAFPQYCSTGMTTEEIADHPDRKKQDEEIGAGFQAFGTIHHHCNGSAFQSGVDKHNEENQNGIHITVGKISQQQYDLDGRVVLRGTQTRVNWGQWFEAPDEIEMQLLEIGEHLTAFSKFRSEFPIPGSWETNIDKLRNKMMETELKVPPVHDIEIPDQWIHNLIPKYKYQSYGNYQGSHHHGAYSGNGNGMGSGGARTFNDPSETELALAMLEEKMIEETFELANRFKITPYRAWNLMEGIVEARRVDYKKEMLHESVKFKQPVNEEEKSFCIHIMPIVMKGKTVMGLAAEIIKEEAQKMIHEGDKTFTSSHGMRDSAMPDGSTPAGAFEGWEG